MRIKSQKDFISGLAIIAVGAAFAIGATNYSFGIAARPGPGYFPFGLGIIQILLGLFVLITSFVKDCEGGDPIGAIPWRPLLCITGAIIFFGYFPFGLGIIQILLGLFVLITSFVKDCEGGEPIGAIPWRPLLCITGAIIFFGYFLPKAGFLISFPIMIVLTAAGSTEFTWKDALLNAAILTAMSYAIFIYGLKLNIPVWPA